MCDDVGQDLEVSCEKAGHNLSQTEVLILMSIQPLIFAAQYLRMSTERQEYSLENQSQTIATYAEAQGFSVVQTYSDPAISGVQFRRRKGLRQLIQDVVERKAAYKVVLVLDVSRWGRFQDIDESAYYEFLCKSAGVRVHYCAETFSNDDDWPNMIMKTLKRVMAGEYSRELGVKVFAGQKRGALLGFRQGAVPGYGFRRMLVSADKSPKQLLSFGERKGLATDRVILVPGPAEEVKYVREIYQMFIQKGMYFTVIARELNRRNVRYIEGSEWNERAVKTILTHPKYTGCNVYGRYTQKLCTPAKQQPRSTWAVAPDAFEPIVDAGTFAKAQHIVEQTRKTLPRNKSDEELLDGLRQILYEKGRITAKLIKKSGITPSEGAYKCRFGTLGHAYELIGYRGFWNADGLETLRRIKLLRCELMHRIVAQHPTHVSIDGPVGRQRARLRLRDGSFISVIASRPFRIYKGAVRWMLKPVKSECHLISLVARLNEESDAFKDIFVTPPVGKWTGFHISEFDPWLQHAIRLLDVNEFVNAVGRMKEVIADNVPTAIHRMGRPRTDVACLPGRHG
jgi:DNA invertase Pin-like site-specific DNA recombinase